MATGQINRVIHHIRRAAFLHDVGEMTDGQMLEQFLVSREEAAFESIVRRHGPMVLGVCGRVLQNPHDAEDAFQATFLVLLRKAASLVPRTTVGNWLYGVAYHTALKARAQAQKRRTKEAQVRRDPHVDEARPDWQPLLDEEMSRLPDKYREPIVLCELEGKTRREAAVQLGIPEGTLSGRLTTGRRQLAKRLARRGVTLSAGALAGILSQSAVSAGVPAPLMMTTVKAAAVLAAGKTAAGVVSLKVAALTDGVLKAMLMTKLKVTAAFLLVLGALTFGGIATHNALADDTSAAAATATENPATSTEPVAAQRPKKVEPKDGGNVSGKLDSIDAEKNTVTLNTFKRGEGNVVKTYGVAKDAKIVRDGKDIKLSDLKQGAQATLKLSADQKTATAITTGTPAVSAPLKAVDADKNTITVTVGNRNAKEDKTFQVSKDAKISIDGKDGKLADLKSGTTVQIQVVEGTTVTSIRTATRKDRKQDE